MGNSDSNLTAEYLLIYIGLIWISIFIPLLINSICILIFRILFKETYLYLFLPLLVTIGVCVIGLIFVLIGRYMIIKQGKKMDLFKVKSPESFIKLFTIISFITGIVLIQVGLLNTIGLVLYYVRNGIRFRSNSLIYISWGIMMFISGIINLINGIILLKLKIFKFRLSIIGSSLNIAVVLFYIILYSISGMLFYSLIAALSIYLFMFLFTLIIMLLKILNNREILERFTERN